MDLSNKSNKDWVKIRRNLSGHLAQYSLFTDTEAQVSSANVDSNPSFKDSQPSALSLAPGIGFFLKDKSCLNKHTAEYLKWKMPVKPKYL